MDSDDEDDIRQQLKQHVDSIRKCEQRVEVCKDSLADAKLELKEAVAGLRSFATDQAQELPLFDRKAV